MLRHKFMLSQKFWTSENGALQNNSLNFSVEPFKLELTVSSSITVFFKFTIHCGVVQKQNFVPNIMKGALVIY